MEFRDKLERKTLKKQRLNKVRMCRKHCKNHSPRHILQKPLATRKPKPNRKIMPKVWKHNAKKTKKKNIHFGADFDSKNHGFSSIFDLLDPQKCSKCCSGCPCEKRCKLRRLLGRIFPDFHGFGLPNWRPKGTLLKSIRLQFALFCATKRSFPDFPDFNGFSCNFHLNFQIFL